MSAATATDKITYRDLYERWEAGNWSASKLDFTQDKHDWNEVFTPHERTKTRSKRHCVKQKRRAVSKWN